MKTLIIKIFFVLFLFINLSQAQNWIKDYPGIPLIAYDSDWSGWLEEDYKKMKDSAGVDVLIATNLSTDNLQKLVTGTGLKTIPNQTISQVNPVIKNWIYFYSEGRYTKWESEGTNPVDGEASIYFKNNIATIFQDGSITGVVTNNYAPSDTLIYGPLYQQEVRYFVTNPGIITYDADFLIKLSNIPHRQGDPLPLPTDPICKLQVTVSDIYIDDITKKWVKYTVPIVDELLTRNSFTIDNWLTKKIIYDLNSLENRFYKNISSTKGESKFAPYVEFKILWLGDLNSKLYVDNIIVSDDRGRQIRNPTYQARIIEQDNATYISSNYEDYITAWIGRDEPESIDLFEPIRIISSVLSTNNTNTRPFIINMPNSWNGRYGDEIPWKNSNYVVKSEEFYKRTKNTQFWQNTYMFDNPFKYNGELWWVDDYRNWNIKMTADSILKRISQVNPDFGQLIMCGKCDDNKPNVSFREILPSELSYSTYLSLMYGAKSLVLFLYYGYDENHTGLINWNGGTKTPTDKFYKVKNIISPRLKGLFGQTLKRLKPDLSKTVLGIECTSEDINIEFIKRITLLSTPGDSIPLFELGFFYDPNLSDPTGLNRYFMLLKRYYPQSLGLQDFNITLRNLSDYNNWSYTNLIDSSNITLHPNQDGEYNTNIYQLDKGDVLFFRLAPVVKYGGKLIYDETVVGGTTLTDEMTIENGATLTINDMYYANANITVKSGGKIIAGTNGKIIFAPNKSIIAEGNAEIKGFANTNNKLSLEFSNSTAVGVETRFGTNLNISNCNIKNAIVGIKVENGSTANISYVDFMDCSDNAVVMFGFGNGENAQTLATPTVYRCAIENSSTGISAVNCDQLVLKENTIKHCNLGIFLNMVNSAYISSNTILGWQSSTGSLMPGISMSNGGGYIRNNIIRYHNFGVLLAYASPDLGVNTIENNYKCGVYSSIGSFPNLVQQLANPQCWYPIGGCNVVRNNGTFTYLPPSTPEIQPDGAEIFLNSGDVLLSYGYNEISDDRTGIPTYLTIPLIKGTRSRGGSKEFFVDHNYWGTTGPSLIRFGTLEADYDPTADYCPLPDMPCSGNEIIIQTTDGIAVDTIGSRERDSGDLAALDESYALADKLFYSGDLEGAKIIYQQIVSGPYTSEEKLFAYKKLYEIGEILKEDATYFSALQNAFNSILSVETDTLLIKTYKQSSILCDVSKEEYLTAISKFDNIIQQNPNSEEAIYAEIDIITTALNLDTTNSQLGKIAGGKYLVKGASDYLSKLNDILQSKFGINSEEKEQIIPKEYSLYQNYPNPFNPVTTIKYDLPNDGLITLEIFDILGRRITTLVDEYKTAGRYEQVFNASSLASGVYVYKLQAGEFISSKKMLLIK